MSPLLRVNVLSHCSTELLTHLSQCTYSCSAYFCEFWSEFNFDSIHLVLNQSHSKNFTISVLYSSNYATSIGT